MQTHQELGIPARTSPHFKFWEEIMACGRVWCSASERWIDVDSLCGDANAIQRYDPQTLSLKGPARAGERLVRVKTFLVWRVGAGCEASRGCAERIRAAHHADAASIWAMLTDARGGNYAIVGGEAATVLVAEDEEGSEAVRFTITGEPVPVYIPKRA